jgi:cell division protein FtsQ
MWDNPRLLNFIAGMLTAFSVVMLGAALVAWASRHPAFAIRHVVFTGELRHLNPAHLRAIVAEELRGTFFTLNLDRARLAFVRVPWVSDVSVRRRWPNQLEVSLAEYKPLARWNQGALVDVDGRVFEASYDGELPLLTGPDGSERKVTAAYYRFGKSLAALNRGIAELSLSERRAWEVRLDNGLAIELGRDEAEARLGRFVAHYRRAMAPLLRDETLKVETVDMRYRNGFAVALPGFREPGAKREGAKAGGTTAKGTASTRQATASTKQGSASAKQVSASPKQSDAKQGAGTKAGTQSSGAKATRAAPAAIAD